MKTFKKLLFAGVLLSFVAVSANPAYAQGSDALGMMEKVFEGDHSRTEIKRRLDKAMRLYDVPITEENYSRAGSVLVELCNMAELEKATEMKILSCMIEAHAPGVSVKFPDMAGLCATQLSSR